MAAYFTEFLALAGLHLLAVISPGPDFAMAVRQGVRFGRRVGIYTAAGIGSGISVHIAYTVLGVGVLIQRSPELYAFARGLGCAYLLYLAFHLLRAKPVIGESAPGTDDGHMTAHRAFWIGFLTNATNPKATLFFLSLFTLVVSAETPVLVQVAYGLWMCIVTAAWFVLVVLLFSAPRIRTRFLRFRHWFDQAMGALILVLAARLLLTF